MFKSLKNLFGGSGAAPQPTSAEDALVLRKRGNEALAQGHLDEATRFYRKALALASNDVATLVNLGFVLNEQRRYAEARSHLEKATGLEPKHDDALYMLATVERKSGSPERAIELFRAALAVKPDFAECRRDLCRLLLERGDMASARQAVEAALAIEPDAADLHCFVGILHHDARDLDRAIACYEKALAIQPGYAEVHGHWAISLQERGDLDGSIARSRQALQLNPELEGPQHNLLFALNYHPDMSPEEIFAAYRDYDRRVGLPLRTKWVTHPNSHDAGRRLKVGYVSPDFRQHVVGLFLEPLLAHHDKSVIEVFAYAQPSVQDAATTRYKRYVDHWIPTKDLDDDALAARIRADGVDILVDLAGHTASNRLHVFARKPAPVSLSWLGFGYTTGLSAIDYLLTDDACAPPGSEPLFSEQPWRLATPAFAYRPAEGMGEVSALPAMERGFVTFGTLTRAIRVNHRTIKVWSQILHRIPQSRLVVDSGSYQHPNMCAALLEKFSAHGIGPERLQIGYHTPPWDVLRDIDIALDCFPHNSGTTLFESLYMGLPYVTLAGRPSVGRLGSSILIGVGHPEWIAHTEDEYVEKCVALASDLPALATLRASLRDQMRASALMDEAGFARKVEAAYREMFKRWAARPDRR